MSTVSASFPESVLLLGNNRGMLDKICTEETVLPRRKRATVVSASAPKSHQVCVQVRKPSGDCSQEQWRKSGDVVIEGQSQSTEEVRVDRWVDKTSDFKDDIFTRSTESQLDFLFIFFFLLYSLATH